MKLTKTQQEVVDLLKQGWELAIGRDFHGGCWVQEGGIGRGGRARNIRSDTAHALVKKGVVRCVSRKFPTSVYVLKENDGKDR